MNSFERIPKIKMRGIQKKHDARVTSQKQINAIPSAFRVRQIQEAIHRNANKKKKQRLRNEKNRHAPLPQQIIPMDNYDKEFHEEWYEGRDLLDIPHPFRAILSSKPNGGKTTVIFNVALRVHKGKRPFEKILIVHCDPEETKEYDDIDPKEIVGRIPAVREMDPDAKTLVILEDLDYENLDHEQRGRLDRLFGYVSTHKNVSVMLTAQDPFRVPPIARRCANLFIVWNNHDLTTIQTLAKKLTLPSDTLQRLFREKCPNTHDSLWFDFTANSPAKVRQNGYEIILMDTNEGGL